MSKRTFIVRLLKIASYIVTAVLGALTQSCTGMPL